MDIDKYDELNDKMEENYKDTWSWLLWKQNNHTAAIFSSGWGDGF